MKEIISKLIGKKVVIETLGQNHVGVISSVEDKYLTLEGNEIAVINLEYILSVVEMKVKEKKNKV